MTVLQTGPRRKRVLLATAALMLAMLLFPPFHVIVKGADTSMGYRWLFSPPRWDARTTAAINVPLLLVQLLLAGAAGGAAFVLAGRREAQTATRSAGGAELVTITCPRCHFERQLPPERIPARARNATCPRCRQRFLLHATGSHRAIIPAEEASCP